MTIFVVKVSCYTMCSNSEYKAAKFHVRFIRLQSGFVYLYTSIIKNFIIINRKACVNVHALSIGLAFSIYNFDIRPSEFNQSYWQISSLWK